MQVYLELMRDVIDHGIDKTDRTGVGTRSVFGRQIRCDLRAGFPLLTTKAVAWRLIVHELLWFLAGSTNNNNLNAHGVKIWNEWAAPDGQLGPIYGAQWRNWVCPDGRKIDQINELIENIQQRPHSRRLIVSAWNPADLPDEARSPQENVAAGRMALAPCHCLFQFSVTAGYLSCQVYQRSADLFLGVPFNLASYALLTHLIAQQCSLEVGELIYTFGDLHLYRNHLIPQIVYTQLERDPRPLPCLNIKHHPASLFNYRIEDIQIIGYDPHPSIRAPIAI